MLLICGVVTYVTALQRYGTVDAIGNSIADLDTPLLVAFLLCAVGAVTSAVASSAAILGALIPLAVPFLVQGERGVSAVVVALAVSATVVDCTPFSTVGALVLANTDEGDRPRVYRTMIGWGPAVQLTGARSARSARPRRASPCRPTRTRGARRTLATPGCAGRSTT